LVQRLAPELRAPVDAGRLLILSGFPASATRVTAEQAARRNELVAALADEIWFAHVTPGGQVARLTRSGKR
jgi:predicted Rossmann fold nucleotide-binding protein DprA/Smf involved in DNA uptake